MSASVWLWIGLGMVTFGLGFLLSWWHMRRRLQRRVNEVVAEEVSRRLQERVLDELRGDTPGSQRTDPDNRGKGNDEHE